MKLRAPVILACFLAMGAVAMLVALVVGKRPDEIETAAALIERYCVDCHNDSDFAGSLRLDNRDLAVVGHDAEIWERVARKLRSGMMPPADAARPDSTELEALAATLELQLDEAAAERPVRGAPRIRRLNRTEYANAIRDLLDLDFDAGAYLPLDDSSEGFDNIAASLSVSPTLVEAYVSAAMKISRLALGDRTAPRTQIAYSAPPDLAQDMHLDGFPLGTRGGLQFEHFFPLDAEYEFSLGLGRGLGQGGGADFSLDGQPVDTGNDRSFRIPVSAGTHTVSVTLVDSQRADGVDDIYSSAASTSGIQGVEIDGPIDASGVGDTPSRRKILSCVPASAAAEASCAQEILSNLARRAFHRPPSAETLQPMLDFYAQGRAEADFEAGIERALSRLLLDPQFLYRIERAPPGSADGAGFAIDAYDLAARLSFFIWSSIPDDALLGAAQAGKLMTAEGLQAEVSRMLADPKADALIDNFAGQWLTLRELDSVTPDTAAFTENLRQSMWRETQMLVAAIMREDLSITTLLDADFTFVDERLAEHYGLKGVRGSHFRRIQWPADDPRRGLLGHASILTLTSVTNRTSPVLRGSWVLETLLGSPPPAPPPNVETTLAGDDGAEALTSVRERLEAHRANPACASCHATMDPIGFALEPYDLIGAWRESDGGQPIDASASLVDGTVVVGPAALREALTGRADVFVTTAVEKLMTYALGRRLEYDDMPAVRRVVEQAAAHDYRFSAIIEAIAASEAFRTGLNEGAEL